MAGLGLVDKSGFIIALGSSWVGRWGLTGKPQATAVTSVCLRLACVSYEAIFFRRPVFGLDNLRFISFWLWAVCLWSLVVGYQWLSRLYVRIIAEGRVGREVVEGGSQIYVSGATLMR